MKKFLFATIFFACVQICKADIVVSTPTAIPGSTWNLNGQTLRFKQGGRITGTGTITNGFIDANYNQEIFDVGITIQLNPYNENFSACWFGAKAQSGFDNSASLQKAISTCITLKIPLFIPPLGIYSYSQPLLISDGGTSFAQVQGFHMFGGYQVGAVDNLTTLNFTGVGSAYALGMQNCKGIEINNLRITGRFIPPTTTDDNVFYLITSTNYTDAGASCNSDYSGIVVDPVTAGGSTGIKMHDLFVSNFAVDFAISPANSQNSDILIFENIHVADSKIGFQSGYAQSKGNVVRGLYSTGKMHTLISVGRYGRGQAGFWNFDGGYVSGKCIRFADIKIVAWYSTRIKDFYCENLGSVGTLIDKGSAPPNNRPAIYVQGCNFDLVWTNTQQVILYTNSNYQKFESCRFRYPTHYQAGTNFYRTSYPNYNGGLGDLKNCLFNCPIVFSVNLYPSPSPVFIME